MENYYRTNIIDFAMIHLGKKYIFGASGPDEFDDTGFSFYIFKELFGIDITKDGYGIGESTKQMTCSIGTLTKYIENDENKIKYLEKIQPGDLLFFHTQALGEAQPTSNNQYPGHVGIYLNDNKFIHANSKDGVVKISLLENEWFSKLVASRDIVSGIVLKGIIE